MNTIEILSKAKEYSLGSELVYQDWKKMAALYKKAFKLGDVVGGFYYALCLFEGTGVTKNIEKAIKIATPIAQQFTNEFENNNFEHSLMLADSFSFGLVNNKDFNKAYTLYLISSNNGSLEAMCDLGYMNLVGQGTILNEKLAFDFYLKSAQLGYLHSMRDVALLYLDGIGTDLNIKKAIQFLELASSKNYSHATNDLAKLYLNGDVVKKNIKKAEELFKLGFKQASSRTIRDLIDSNVDVKVFLSEGIIKKYHNSEINEIDDNNYFEGQLFVHNDVSFINPSIFYSVSMNKYFVNLSNKYYSSLNGVLFNKDKTILIKYPINLKDKIYEIPNTVITIGKHAFQNARNLENIIIPTGVTLIGDSAFDDCKSLKGIIFPDALVEIGDWAFHGCDKIKAFNLSKNIKKIGKYSFGSCESLKRINVSKDSANYRSLLGVLLSKDFKFLYQYPIGCKEKKYIVPKKVETISFRAFSDAYNLEFVDAKNVKKIESKAFYYAINLQQINLSNNVIVEDTNICNFTKVPKIIIAADVHGSIRLDILKNNLKNLKINEQDVLIIAGDAGIVWNEAINEDVRSYYESLLCNVLFIDGNHENFTLLDKYEITTIYNARCQKVLRNVYHILRGEVCIINGYIFFCFGGGYSAKKEDGTSPVYIWDRELPNEDEYINGINNIKKYDKVIDYIITHQTCSKIINLMGKKIYDSEIKLLQYFDEINKKCDYKKWYFGHYHLDAQINNHICIYAKMEVIYGNKI
jgi:TPR repeat protein